MKYFILMVLLFCNSQLFSQKKINSKSTSERVEVKALAIKALKWFFYEYRDTNTYNDNSHRHIKWGLSYLKGVEGDSTNPYRINFEGVKAYFNYLDKTNLFSRKFTNDLLIYFKKCDSNFIAVKQYYSVPIGFEYNLITKDTDDMEVQENIHRSKISSCKKIGSKVYLSLKFDNRRTYTFIITKYNGKWLIDNINGDFQPLVSTPV